MFKAGADLPGDLGLPEERFRTFIQNNRCLTDDIIKAVEGSSGRTKGSRRTKLADYLKLHKIIPLTWDWDEKRPFFPRELFSKTQSWHHHCFLVFNALMKFENYALNILEIGQPVMFPVALLKSELKNKVKVVAKLHPEGYEAPMFMDYSAHKESCDAYFDAYEYHLNMHRGGIEEDAPAGEGGIRRMEDQYLAPHLEVYDVRRPWIPGRRDNATLRFYELKKGLAPNSLNLNADWKKASVWFSPLLSRAKRHVENYKEMI